MSISSFFKSIAAPVLGFLGGAVAGPVGARVGATIGGGISSRAASKASLPGLPPMTATGPIWGGITGPRQIPTRITSAGGGGGGGRLIGGGLAGAFGGAGRGVARIARGAASLCAKYPQWCLAIGGIQAIAGLMDSGQLPVPKMRRRKGITPKDLSSFRRVATLIKSYGPTARKVPSSCAPRKSCRK